MDPIELTKALCRIPSPSGEETAVVDFMAAHLADLGYLVTRQGVTPNRENLYATLDDPLVVLATHLDVVPPHLTLREDDEWLYGRGVQDAKGIAASMVSAAVRLRDRGERGVALLFTVGEETGSDGAKASAGLGPKSRYLINGEPTENRLCIGQKGALHYILTASGVAAHSAYPEEGVSATEALLDTLARIRALPLPVDPLLGPSTLNIGRLQGGVATNVIPPHAAADLMFRTVAPTAELERAVRAALSPNVTLEIGFDTPFYKAPALPGWDVTTVSYASDLPHLSQWGIGYQMGPGTIRVAHTAHERVRKQDLRDGVDCYVRLISDLIEGAR